MNWPTKETQFVGVAAVLQTTFTYIYKRLGLQFHIRRDSALCAACILRKVCFKRFYATLGWAMKSGTLCRTCKANGRTGIQSFGVNTVQHASATKKKSCFVFFKSSARTLTGCSYIPQTVVPWLAATDRKRAVGTLTTVSQCFWFSPFQHLSPFVSVPDHGNNPICSWGTLTHAVEDEIINDGTHQLFDD